VSLLRTWAAFMAGGGAFSSLYALHQDRFGSLDAYCAWLHQPGNWVDGRWWAVFGLVSAAVVMTVFSVPCERKVDE
jgi:hypothetical protein